LGRSHSRRTHAARSDGSRHRGFTAGLAIVRLERNGLAPGQGPIAITGGTGGVGSIAIAALARLGYEVTAISGKDDARDYLTSLGARDILSRTTLVMGTRPLETARWAGAIDAVAATCSPG
jgi:NADPH2:quinone reductase